jgi:probable rRNA maturation factor
MIHYHNEDHSYSISNKLKIRNWVKKIVELEKKSLGTINYIFVSDEYLLKLNNESLKHDYYTDIITFDYTENSMISGDLFISIDRVIDNAKQLNVLFIDELHRVMIHGVLHLCGYGDKSSKEEKIMRSKEDFSLTLRDF